MYGRDVLNAEPEWLGRRDIENGEWVVEDCEPRRGIPATAIEERIMRAPNRNDELSRVIRAHEMMHAKVSPADLDAWIARKFASRDALIACEEARVNFLCAKAGFKVEEFLTDGGETADGERLALTNDWRNAVYMAVATAGTASNKPFLNGVRRHNRLWGKALLDVSKRVTKELQKAYTSNYRRSFPLASTDTHPHLKLAPAGFIHTEKLGEWIDRLAGMTPPQEQTAQEETANEESETKSERAHANYGAVKPRTEKEELGRLKTITPDSRVTTPYWGDLVVERMPMPKLTMGNLGVKRTASNTGRYPRRLHRYATDPDKRIFDRTTRGLGGVVIIDGSGSMSFTHDEIRKIVEASPGCTVAVYSDMDNSNGDTNMWVLADKGRMVSELPNVGGGNGVDFPALEWGVKHRQHSRSPVIWVTDGGVCGPNQGFSEMLAMQCINFCKQKRVIVVGHVEEAVTALRELKNGRRTRRRWGYMLKEAYKNRQGETLVEDEIG